VRRLSARRRLLRRLWVGGPDGERGAVAVAVALLFPLLLIAAGLAVDTAATWNARTQVISSGDSVALAGAMDCANGDCGTDASRKNLITYYSVANNSGAKLATLKPGLSWLQTRPADRVALVNGDWTIEHLFAGALGVGPMALSVRSMARWSGAPSAAAELPVAVSSCAYQSAASHGIGSTAATLTVSLSTVAGAGCTSPTGGSVSGTSVLTAATGSGCGTTSTAGSTVTVVTAKPAACTASYLTDLVGDAVRLPVYDQATSGSARIYGYAALRVTSVTTGTTPTVSGYLVWDARQINTPATVPTAPDLGARTVFLWDPDTWTGPWCPC
jgi:hypothetical protein